MTCRAKQYDCSQASAERKARRQKGFTITELMVVITIMTVLSAILLPALNKSRSRSHAITCLNNLRQLQLSWQMYPDDNEDILPANNYVNGFKMGMLTVSSGPSWCPGDAINDVSTDNIKKGVLFSYNNSTSIYRCPADTSKVQTPATDMLRTRSYKMSGSINCTVSSAPSYRKLHEITAPHPSRLFVFIDAHESSMVDPHFTLPTVADDLQTKKKVWIDVPSSRHDQAGNLSFADGHIERWRWKTAKNFTSWQQSVSEAEVDDFRRLQAAMRQP
jgi:prepilin-type N-terminal cleavage/methylation domain-containing protein/prepilin-type processing-associated H-X9-DG protein